MPGLIEKPGRPLSGEGIVELIDRMVASGELTRAEWRGILLGVKDELREEQRERKRRRVTVTWNLEL